MWGQRVSITLAFFKAASGMPVAGGNDFLTEHMVFSRGRAVRMPSCVAPHVGHRQVQSRVPANRTRILGRD